LPECLAIDLDIAFCGRNGHSTIPNQHLPGAGKPRHT
jgi:hypothetical protein